MQRLAEHVLEGVDAAAQRRRIEHLATAARARGTAGVERLHRRVRAPRGGDLIGFPLTKDGVWKEGVGYRRPATAAASR